MAGATLPGRLTWTLARVREVLPETEGASTLVLDVPGWPGHRPGQHVDIRLTADDGYQAERSYSISSAPDGERVELTIERLDDGEVSPYLTEELRPGDQLELRGPIGGYFTWDASDGGPLLLVGGGSGIVPLMAMLRHRAAIGNTVPARVIGSFRTAGRIIYGDELRRLAAGDPDLAVTLTLTRTRPPDWGGASGRVDTAMLTAHGWPPAARPLAFVCGPTPFVEAVASSLVAIGHEASRVKTERFGPTGG
jgi:ferredoxin-NADP reductase